jgi:hypothetical protein
LKVVVGNRVLVLLAEKPLINQHIDARRGRIRELSLKQADGAGILLASEDELFFLLPLGHVRPDRQHRAHQDRHHAQADQQGHHGIASVPRLHERAAPALTL